MSEPKQVIVMRTDLRNQEGHKIRTGKLIAQGAHASLQAILGNGIITTSANPNEDCRALTIDLSSRTYPGLSDWLANRFTKICVGVNSEEELLKVYQAAYDAGILCKSLILDAGLTEFGGKETYTCAAIGPEYPEKIDLITGHLRLL